MLISVKQRDQGILCIIGAAFFFALMNLFIRLSGDLPTMQKCFFRNAVAAVLAVSVIIKNGGKFRPGKGNMKYLFMRAFCGTAGLICNFYAIDRLNISDASILNKLSPFFAILFSIPILGEKADKVEWAIVLSAFAGAMFVVKPSFGAESFPAVVGLIGGLGAGIAYVYVRKLGQRSEQGSLIVLFFSLFSCAVSLPFIIFGYAPMTAQQFMFLVLTGCSAAGGQFCITAAYTKAPAKEISVYDYSQVIFAAALGALFLGQLPDHLSFIGYAIIITAAIVRRQYGIRKDKKAAERQQSENTCREDTE